MTYASIIRNTIPIAVELLFIPSVLNTTSACHQLVSYILHFYLTSRPRIVKVFAYGLFDVIVIILHTLAVNTVELLRKSHLNSMYHLRFGYTRNQTQESIDVGTGWLKGACHRRNALQWSHEACSRTFTGFPGASCNSSSG